MVQDSASVVVVGAGGAGLSLSLLLLQQGIRPLLVERRPEVSWYPRARHLNFRTMEIFRSLGLAAEIHEAGAPVSRVFARKELAAREETEVLDPGSLLDTTALSPEPCLWFCPQSRLEPLLQRAARQRGADVRCGTELTRFAQSERGVSATLKDLSTGRSQTVEAQFLVGCDGSRSAVRAALDIPIRGRGELDEYYVFVYFRARWGDLIRGHEGDAFMIEGAEVRGMFLVTDENLGMFILFQRKAETTDGLTRQRAAELVRKAIGRPEIAVEIVEVASWRPVQRVADRFQNRRVFLVGDAAHTMPPKEGLGVNTAIQSAQNLGWKLAAVLGGWAQSALLSTYTTERRPVASFVSEHALTGPANAMLGGSPLAREKSEFFPTVGYRYRSEAVVSEDAGPAPASDAIALLDRQELTGIPGTRVPHLWLERGARQISTLDLLDGGFVLLTGAPGTEWREAASTLRHEMGVRVTPYRLGPLGDLGALDGAWAARLGITGEGAVLIRPDGFVAWRSSGASSGDPRAELQRVMTRVLCRAGGNA